MPIRVGTQRGGLGGNAVKSSLGSRHDDISTRVQAERRAVQDQVIQARVGPIALVKMLDVQTPSSIGLATSTSGTRLNVWSPLSTSSMTTGGVNLVDFTNSYANGHGCFTSVGLGNDCTARSLSK